MILIILFLIFLFLVYFELAEISIVASDEARLEQLSIKKGGRYRGTCLLELLSHDIHLNEVSPFHSAMGCTGASS